MKVLILGSMKSAEGNPNNNEFGLFQNACKQIGSFLAAGKHEILVGSDNNLTADRYVLAGVAESDVKCSVTVHYPEVPDPDHVGDENRIPFVTQDGARLFPKLKIRHMPHPGSWAVAHLACLYACDVVILIGGAKRCDLVGAFAKVLQKPILPIKLFDGAADALWADFQVQAEACGLNDAELGAISTVWDEESGSAVVAMAGKVYKNTAKKGSILNLILLIVVGFAALGAWFWVWFQGKADVQFSELASFILLGCSVVVGTAFRVLREHGLALTLLRVLRELAAGVFLAFIFLLLYLVGAFTLTGNITSQMANASDFTRITVIFSVIGFGTGLLVDQLSETLPDSLLSVFQKRKSGT